MGLQGARQQLWLLPDIARGIRAAEIEHVEPRQEIHEICWHGIIQATGMPHIGEDAVSYLRAIIVGVYACVNDSWS